MDMDRVECMVVGAGVVGIAVARALALTGREVVLVEENAHIGEETSSRNNEVIHAGFLYPPGSLKERLCRPGRERLYAYCEERRIGYRRLGKLMPATSDTEYELLEAYKARAEALGMDDVELLDPATVCSIEPDIVCRGALYSPSSGIVDSHGLMVSLLGDAEARGVALATNSRVSGVTVEDSGALLVDITAPGEGSCRLECDELVNAAGLGALPLARAIKDYPAEILPRVFFAKGSYFSYQGRVPFRRLVMPVGQTLAGGGALTLDLAGQGRFGPNLEWVEHRDYQVDPAAAASFAASVRRYWPGLEAHRLAPGYAGIRPRTTGPGEPLADWVVQGPRDHGIAGLINLFAVETPGLTACLATADYVLELLRAEPRPCIHTHGSIHAYEHGFNSIN